MMNDLVQSNPSPDKYSFVVHVDPLLRSIIGVDPQNAFYPVLASCTLPLAAVNSTRTIGVHLLVLWPINREFWKKERRQNICVAQQLATQDD